MDEIKVGDKWGSNISGIASGDFDILATGGRENLGVSPTTLRQGFDVIRKRRDYNAGELLTKEQKIVVIKDLQEDQVKLEAVLRELERLKPRRQIIGLPTKEEFIDILLSQSSATMHYINTKEPLTKEDAETTIESLAYGIYGGDKPQKENPLRKVADVLTYPRLKKAILKDVPSMKSIAEFVESKAFTECVDTTKQSIVEVVEESFSLLSYQDTANACWDNFQNYMNKHTRGDMAIYWQNTQIVVEGKGRSLCWYINFVTGDKESYKRAIKWFDECCLIIFRKFLSRYFGFEAGKYFRLGYCRFDPSYIKLQLPTVAINPPRKNNSFVSHRNNKSAQNLVQNWVDDMMSDFTKKKGAWIYSSSKFEKEQLLERTIDAIRDTMPWLEINYASVCNLSASLMSAIDDVRNNKDEKLKRDKLNIFQKGIESSDVLIIEGFDNIIGQYSLMKRLGKLLETKHILITSDRAPSAINALLKSKTNISNGTISEEQYNKFTDTVEGFVSSSCAEAPIVDRFPIVDNLSRTILGLFDLPNEVKALIMYCIPKPSLYENAIRKLNYEKDRRINEQGEIEMKKVTQILGEMIELNYNLELHKLNSWFDSDFVTKIEEDDRCIFSSDDKDELFVYLAYQMTKINPYLPTQNWEKAEIGVMRGKKESYVTKAVGTKYKRLEMSRFSKYYVPRQQYCKDRLIEDLIHRASVYSTTIELRPKTQ